MRIVIDMQGAQSDSRYRGIGRYTLSFVRALLEQKSKHEFYLVLNGDLPESIERIRDDLNDLIPQSRIRTWYQPQPGGARESQTYWRRRASELIRESLILSLNPDLVHITSFFEGYVDSSTMGLEYLLNNGVLVSVSLYDLIPLINSSEYLEPDPKYGKFYRSQLKQFRKAHLFLGISAFTCKQAIEYLELNPNSVANVSAAVSPKLNSAPTLVSASQEVLNRLGLKKDFILCVGGGDPRKNLLKLAQAYTALEPQLRLHHDLVLIGPNIPIVNIQSLVGEDYIEQIHILGHISDEDLWILYKACTIFVYPSLYEGFGLPPLEAMSCGALVISSDSTSLPEVVGLAEALFDASSVDAMTAKISEVLTNKDLRTRLIAHGKLQSKLFSWSETAKKSLDAMSKLLDCQNKYNKYDQDEIYQKLLTAISVIPRSEGKPRSNDLILCAKAIADTFPQKPDFPRIFVDISELVQRDSKTGIQRVTRSILHELLVNPPEGFKIEPVYGTIERIGYKFAHSFTRQLLNSADPIGEDGFIDPQAGDIFLGLDLQHHTTRVQSEYLQSIRRSGVMVYFVVYDLLPIQFPHFWPPEHGVDKVHEEWLNVVCQSDGAFCISKAVADELANWMMKTLPPKPNFQISWFHLGADLQGSVPTFGLPENGASILSALSIRKSFLLVGTVEPRKGYSQVLEAFELLWTKGVDVNLVIVGKIGWGVDELLRQLENHPELGKRLFWLQGVSDEYLEKVYEYSTCLIAASYGEGFGLPLIEAAQHRLPIIARDIPVFREVANRHAFFYSSSDRQDFADTIISWLGLYENGLHITSIGMPWQTWKQSARQLLGRLVNK